jgi:hypothetical protein
MFVYRDNGEEEDYPTPAPVSAADEEAAYWYGPLEPAEPEPAEEARGPFEPLISSSDPPRDHDNLHGYVTVPEVPEPEEAPSDMHAQKLEQIKDFYLTAEAIGEENVDKHFDQLLAQQRDLISEYFKQAGARRGAGAEDVPDDDLLDDDLPGESIPAEGVPEAGESAGATPADAAW